jgi:hypothetical protein
MARAKKGGIGILPHIGPRRRSQQPIRVYFVHGFHGQALECGVYSKDKHLTVQHCFRPSVMAHRFIINTSLSSQWKALPKSRKHWSYEHPNEVCNGLQGLSRALQDGANYFNLSCLAGLVQTLRSGIDKRAMHRIYLASKSIKLETSPKFQRLQIC